MLTVNETAQILRVSPGTVRRYIRSGLLTAKKLGGESGKIYLIAPESIEEILKETNRVDDGHNEND